jgi:hypothetical protein
MSNKINRDSALVKSVLALDSYLSELERVGAKINSTDMTSDFDLEYIQKLMARFAECGQGVSQEVNNLSTQLQEARARAEAVAHAVSRQAELLSKRRNEQNVQLEKFRILGEKVRDLNAIISQFRRPVQDLTEQDRADFTSNIPAIEKQLVLLIEELHDLQKCARDIQMKILEKNAESLAQSLEAVHRKLRALNPFTTGGNGNPN